MTSPPTSRMPWVIRGYQHPTREPVVPPESSWAVRERDWMLSRFVMPSSARVGGAFDGNVRLLSTYWRPPLSVPFARSVSASISPMCRSSWRSRRTPRYLRQATRLSCYAPVSAAANPLNLYSQRHDYLMKRCKPCGIKDLGPFQPPPVGLRLRHRLTFM